MSQVPAPIESVEVVAEDVLPPQYSLVVVSGLRDSCAVFGGYYMDRGDDTIRVEMVNSRPSDPELMCAQVYRTVETAISLGSRFEPGATYTVRVNDVTTTFLAMGSAAR